MFFALNNVRPKVSRDHRCIGMHIEHRFYWMAYVPDARGFEIVKDFGNTALFCNFGVCQWIVMKRAHDRIRDFLAHANCYPRKFR